MWGINAEKMCLLDMADCYFSDQDVAWTNYDLLPPAPEVSSETTSFYFHGNCPPHSYSPNCSIPQEDRAASASRNHSEAEKRRRDRINTQLTTLRKLIPKSDKMDKAALLGSAIEHVKDLKRKAMELSKVSAIPGDVDEVTINYLDKEEESSAASKNNIFIQVSFCCEDRPELFSEINGAFQGLKLTILQAEMSSLAGRIKTIFILSAMEENSCMETIKQSLKVILNRIVISCPTSNYRIKSKRQRFFLPAD